MQSNIPVNVGLLNGFKLPITPISRQEFLDRTSADTEEIDTEAVRDSCQAHLEHGIIRDGVYKVKVDGASVDVYVVFERNIDLWRNQETLCYCIYILSTIREKNTL